AGRRVWRWSGPALQVTGMLLVIAGVVVQSLWGQVEEKSLPLAAAAAPTGIAGQEVRLKTFDPVPDTTGNLLGGAVAVKLQDGPTVVWQLYRPYRLNGWWVIPTTAGAVAHVSFVQGQTVQKLDLAFGNPAKPARFVHSPANLTFELRYRATYRGPAYRLRVIDGPDGGPGDVKVQQQGHTFLVEGANLRGEVAVDDRLRLRAYHLPGLAPLAMGGLLFLLGAVQGVWPPPGIIRLAVVTKGRGSRIEAEIESLDDEPITGEMSLLNFEAGDDERTD
ncbi:MAG: hypothetical protein ACE5G8_17895, partial [Anaerolineae bacterium]